MADEEDDDTQPEDTDKTVDENTGIDKSLEGEILKTPSKTEPKETKKEKKEVKAEVKKEEKAPKEEANSDTDDSDDTDSAAGVDPKVLAATAPSQVPPQAPVAPQPVAQPPQAPASVTPPTKPLDLIQQAQGQADQQHGQANLLRSFQQALQAASRGNMKADNSVANSVDAQANDLENRAKERMALQTQMQKQQRDDQVFQLTLRNANLNFQDQQAAADPTSPQSKIAQDRVIQMQKDMGKPVNEAAIRQQSGKILFQYFPYLQKDLSQYYQSVAQKQKLDAQAKNTAALIAGRKDVSTGNNETKKDIAADNNSTKEDVADIKNQAKISDVDAKDSKDLGTFLQKGWTARSGAAGLVQAKINNAEAAQALIDQGKGQEGGLDSRQYEELAESVSKLVGGNNQASARIEALVPKTLMGRAQTLKEYLLNTPEGQDKQEFVQRLEETVAREKALAQQQKSAFQVEGLPSHARLKKNNPKQYAAILKAAGVVDPNNDDSSTAPTSGGATPGAPAPATPLKTSVGPYGDTTQKPDASGVMKTYKWNSAVNKYQLIGQ